MIESFGHDKCARAADLACATPRLRLDFADHRLAGKHPFATFEAKNGHWRWMGDGNPIGVSGNDTLAAIRQALAWARETRGTRGAAIGFISYDAAREWEPRAFNSSSPPDDLQIPDVRLVFCEELESMPQSPGETSVYKGDSNQAAPDVPQQYRDAVNRIREYITAGDIYQANFTQRFQTPHPCPPGVLYERLQATHPARFGALLEWDDLALVSNSPERFLKLEGRQLTAQPIKGTIARGSTLDEDKTLAQTLLASTKDRAENVMIVDLLRNDLGRVCEFGSVCVPELFALQTLPSLYHLVSTVTGVLRRGLDGIDALSAAFPCGSITGAPKIRAMQIIDELEPVRRGAAMGAIGYFAFNGDMEWNVAIRTVTYKDNVAYFHVGGGIVADSTPESEYAEMLLKAQAIRQNLSVG